MTARVNQVLKRVAIGVCLIGVAGWTGFVGYEYMFYGIEARTYPEQKIEPLIGRTLEDINEFAQENGYELDPNPLIWSDVEQVLWIPATRGTWGVGLVFKGGRMVNYHILYSNMNSALHHNKRLH